MFGNIAFHCRAVKENIVVGQGRGNTIVTLGNFFLLFRTLGTTSGFLTLAIITGKEKKNGYCRGKKMYSFHLCIYNYFEPDGALVHTTNFAKDVPAGKEYNVVNQ
jgi:hypothetical protein